MGVDLYCRSDRERSLSIGEPQPVSSSAKLMGTKVRNPDHGGVYARGLDGHCRGEVWDESWLGRTDGLDPAGSPDHLSQLYVPPLRALHHQLKDSDGATLFYTASTQPQTYTLLRTYLLHRLFTVPPPLSPTSDTLAHPPSRFPFPHRANVLDRDAVMVPAGWDSWGKIKVLRDSFDPGRVLKAWEASLARAGGEEGDEEGLEDLWVAVIPDTERGIKVCL